MGRRKDGRPRIAAPLGADPLPWLLTTNESGYPTYRVSECLSEIEGHAVVEENWDPRPGYSRDENDYAW